MKARLRVLLDAVGRTDPPTGLGVYASGLTAALAERPEVEVYLASPTGAPPGVPLWRPLPGARQLWRQTVLPIWVAREGIDIVHGLEFGAPLRSPSPRVVTVHDVCFLAYPKAYSLRARLGYRALLGTALRAERIIVPTRAAAADLLCYTDCPSENVRVVGEAPAPGWEADLAAAETLPPITAGGPPYLLAVGFNHPCKRVVDALRALPALGHMRLLIAGADRRGMKRALLREAQGLGVEARVEFVGHLSGPDLASLVIHAWALVFVSLYEGFGIPPLEAMAAGTPVIASDVPAVSEVVGDAALLVPPGSPEAIAAAVGRLEAPSLRAELAARGRERAALHSWERAAAETVEVYRELA